MKLVKNILMKKISKISKKNNKYILLLSDNSSLSFYGEVIIKYNLLKPRSISDNELKEITRKLQKLLFFKGEIESLVNDNLF